MSREYIAIANALREKKSRDNRALLDAAACAIEELIEDLGTVRSVNELLEKTPKLAYTQGFLRFAYLLLTLYEKHESSDEITVGELRQHIKQITKDLTGVYK